MALFDEQFCIARSSRCVLKQQLLFFSGHQAEQISRLAVIFLNTSLPLQQQIVDHFGIYDVRIHLQMFYVLQQSFFM